MKSPVGLRLTAGSDGGVPKLVMTVLEPLRLAGAEKIAGPDVAIRANHRSGFGRQIEVEAVSLEMFVATREAHAAFCRKRALSLVVGGRVGLNDDVLILYGDAAGPGANLFRRFDALHL